jgi:hypothetical protein
LSAGLTTPPLKKTIVQKPKELSRTVLRKRPWKRNKAFNLNLATQNARYKTIIRPVVLYGSETWAITGKMASSLMTWERKILRKIYKSPWYKTMDNKSTR